MTQAVWPSLRRRDATAASRQRLVREVARRQLVAVERGRELAEHPHLAAGVAQARERLVEDRGVRTAFDLGVDGEDRVLPTGETGNIRLRAPGMAKSMYGGTTRTTGDTLKEGWAYPGDIGVLDGKGFLQLMGRSSDLIIRGGANVHPSEVEAAIAELPGVREVTVVGFTKLPEGQEIAAFIVRNE